MDDEEFETIRRWAEGLLATDRREEVRAAAKAILMLADEVERLRVDIWHDRLGAGAHVEASAVEGPAPLPDDEPVLYDRLRSRLAGVGRIIPRRHGTGPPVEPE